MGQMKEEESSVPLFSVPRSSKARRRDVIKMKTSMYVQKENNNFNMINYLKASGKYKDFKWRKKHFIKRKKKK